jgi:hypothetical protein
MDNQLPIHLAGSTLDRPRHACAFFRNPEEEYRVLLPFILEGIGRGEKAFHIVRSTNRDDHLHRLGDAGIDVEAAQSRRQLEVIPWQEAYLRGGGFNPDSMLELMEETLNRSKEEGFPLARIIGGAEWALEEHPTVDELLEYEARLNLLLPDYEDAVTCTYDLTKFGAEVVVDALRTHRLVVIGGFLHENPYFLPPDQMLEELRGRKTASHMQI